MPYYMKARTHFFDTYDPNAILEPADPQKTSFTGTKVVFTVGPACQDVETMTQLIEAGATGARIDLTWGPLEFHEKSLQNLQLAMKKARRLCAVLLDTRGREIFVKRPFKIDKQGWPFYDRPISIEANQQIVLTSRDVPFTNKTFPLNYERFAEITQKGDSIYVSRYLTTGAETGALYLKVLEVTDTDVLCEAQSSAMLDGLLTVFIIERNLIGPISNKLSTLDFLVQSDKSAIQYLGNKFEIDFVALSYTRDQDDVQGTRKFLDMLGMTSTKVMAKVETKYALTKIKGILNEADAIMISRGILGMDCPAEKMALIQKNLISWCNMLGKPVIVTRVVDTMVSTPRPTRAEATDVANAVLDGVDGFLLGAETLRGGYVVETIKTVLSISNQAELMFDHTQHFEYLMQEAASAQMKNGSMKKSASSLTVSSTSSKSYADLNNALSAMTALNPEPNNFSSSSNLLATVSSHESSPFLSKLESIASSAVRTADAINASLLVVYTHSGRTAHLVAKYRPSMPIMTLVVPQLISNKLGWKLKGRATARQCLVGRGIMPMLAAPRSSTDSALIEAVVMAAGKGLVKPGDNVVIVQRIHEEFALKIVCVDDLVRKPMPFFNHKTNASNIQLKENNGRCK